MLGISVSFLALVLLLMSGCNPTQTTQKQQQNTNKNSFTLTEQYRQPIKNWPEFKVDQGVHAKELAPLNTLDRTMASKEKINLGKQLFFDPRLSSSKQIACASCHDPELGWADGKRTSFGHNRLRGSRNAMSILNSRYFTHHFWDGRAKGLRDQATQPVENPIEMHETLENVVKTLTEINGYQEQFDFIYPLKAINKETIADALASFQETVISKESNFDKFMQGNYKKLTDQEIHGLHLFRTKARCMNCHHGALLSDNKFHNIGLSYFGRKYEDLGRYNHTNNKEDMGKFRTPSLIDVAFTAPYMHNGLFSSLKGIINMYNKGMTIRKKLKPGEPVITPLIKPLHMNKIEKKALKEFLISASRRPYKMQPPKLPE